MKQNFVGIPVSELMCVDLPTAYVLTDEGALSENELDVFFNTLQVSVGVWADFLTRITESPENWAQPRHEFVDMLQETMYQVFQEDDPMLAWPLRQKLAMMIDQFDEMADEMVRPFTGPHTIRDFYHNLASRVRATFEEIMNGE